MITLVYGPPCSGKTTWVQSQAQPGDLVVDHDLIAEAMGSPVSHNHPSQYREMSEHRVAELLAEVAAGMHPTAWVVRTLADSRARAETADYIRADEVVLVTEDRATLVRRAADRPDPDATVAAIDRWFRVACAPRVRRHPSWR